MSAKKSACHESLCAHTLTVTGEHPSLHPNKHALPHPENLITIYLLSANSSGFSEQKNMEEFLLKSR